MPGFAGFDTDVYPGDAVMDWLKSNTNLVWTGYYLWPAPSHSDKSWIGKRAALQVAGWGIAPVFLGQQVTGPGSKNPSAAQGTTDGTAAAGVMQSEGFAQGSYVYLDIENGPPLTQPQQDYTVSWSAAVQTGGYQPGIYCSHELAAQVHNLVPNARIWVFKVTTIAPHPVPNPFPSPDPSGSGYVGASAWQLGQNCIMTVSDAGAKLTTDVDSGNTADPGAPDS